MLSDLSNISHMFYREAAPVWDFRLNAFVLQAKDKGGWCQGWQVTQQHLHLVWHVTCDVWSNAFWLTIINLPVTWQSMLSWAQRQAVCRQFQWHLLFFDLAAVKSPSYGTLVILQKCRSILPPLSALSLPPLAAQQQTEQPPPPPRQYIIKK